MNSVLEDRDGSKWNTHLAGFKVVKDLNSGRVKGIWMEDMLKVLETFPGCKEVGMFTPGDSYYEKYYVATVNGNPFSFEWANHPLSIPDLKLGCQSQKDWADIRQALRSKGLFR